MTYSEMRKFLLEANQQRLSPAEKDAFLYYDSRIRGKRIWDCPDSEVALDIGRSRNSVCEGRNALKKRGWISEKMPFQIEIIKAFPVENATDTDDSQSETRLESPEPSRERDSSVENATQPVVNATEPVENATAYKDKGKEVKEVKEKPKTPADLVFDFWVSHLKKTRALFTKKRRDHVNARLREGYSVEDIFDAIRGCGVSPHNQGQNDRGEVYDDLELICRLGEKVERFRGIWERHQEGKLVANGKYKNTGKSNIGTLQQSADYFTQKYGAGNEPG